MGRHLNKWTDAWMDGWTLGQMNEWRTDRWMNRQINGRTDELMDDRQKTIHYIFITSF